MNRRLPTVAMTPGRWVGEPKPLPVEGHLLRDLTQRVRLIREMSPAAVTAYELSRIVRAVGSDLPDGYIDGSNKHRRGHLHALDVDELLYCAGGERSHYLRMPCKTFGRIES